VVGITIGSIASVASIDKNVNMFEGVFSIIIWSSLTILISKITLKNIKLRLWINSEPSLIIDKGKVIYLDGKISFSHLPQIQKNEAWVIAQLKVRNIDNIKDVVFAGVQADEQIYIVTKED